MGSPASKTRLNLTVWADCNLFVKASGENISRAFYPPPGQEMCPYRHSVFQTTRTLGSLRSGPFSFCYEGEHFIQLYFI